MVKHNKLKATRHKPPARIRYEQNHPVVSCRLPLDTYMLLKQCLNDLGVSFADFVKHALGLLQLKMPNVEKIEQEAYDAGVRDATDYWRIRYYCAMCGEEMDMLPNSDDHKAMIGYMKEHNWVHSECLKKASS